MFAAQENNEMQELCACAKKLTKPRGIEFQIPDDTLEEILEETRQFHAQYGFGPLTNADAGIAQARAALRNGGCGWVR